MTVSCKQARVCLPTYDNYPEHTRLNTPAFNWSIHILTNSQPDGHGYSPHNLSVTVSFCGKLATFSRLVRHDVTSGESRRAKPGNTYFSHINYRQLRVNSNEPSTLIGSYNLHL